MTIRKSSELSSDELFGMSYDAIEMAPLVLCFNCAEARFTNGRSHQGELVDILLSEGWEFKEVPAGGERAYKWLCQECKEFF